MGKKRVGMKQWKLFKEKDFSILLAKEIDFSLFLWTPHFIYQINCCQINRGDVHYHFSEHMVIPRKKRFQWYWNLLGTRTHIEPFCYSQILEETLWYPLITLKWAFCLFCPTIRIMLGPYHLFNKYSLNEWMTK